MAWQAWLMKTRWGNDAVGASFDIEAQDLEDAKAKAKQRFNTERLMAKSGGQAEPAAIALFEQTAEIWRWPSHDVSDVTSNKRAP